MEENFADEIDNQIRTNFKVTKIPVGTLKRFKKYCKDNCGDVYATGIQHLLDQNELFYELLCIFGQTSHDILYLQERLKKVETQLNSKREEKPAIKTFGDE